MLLLALEIVDVAAVEQVDLVLALDVLVNDNVHPVTCNSQKDDKHSFSRTHLELFELLSEVHSLLVIRLESPKPIKDWLDINIQTRFFCFGL